MHRSRTNLGALGLGLVLLAGGCRIGYQEAVERDSGVDARRPDADVVAPSDADARADAEEGSDAEVAPDGGPPVDAEAEADADADIGPTCGDGVVEAPETCDDSNDIPGDGCEPDCRPSFPEMDNVELLPDPPLDLDSERHAGYLLIPEQLDHVLPADVPVEVWTPGPIDTSAPASGVVPAGSRVHVYLLHLRTGTTDDHVHARVAFDNPVVALIITTDGLVATDWLGVPGLSFDATWRGLDAEDSGTLETRAVEIEAINHDYSDQLRVLVATRPDHGVVVE